MFLFCFCTYFIWQMQLNRGSGLIQNVHVRSCLILNYLKNSNGKSASEGEDNKMTDKGREEVKCVCVCVCVCVCMCACACV